jgi:transposase InsO family protein
MKLKIPKQEYTVEFRGLAVKRVKGGQGGIGAVARELGLVEQTLLNWVKAAAAGKKRVERLMRENGIKARHKRRFKATTDSKHSLPMAPNLLGRSFTPAAPNRRGAPT